MLDRCFLEIVSDGGNKQCYYCLSQIRNVEIVGNTIDILMSDPLTTFHIENVSNVAEVQSQLHDYSVSVGT